MIENVTNHAARAVANLLVQFRDKPLIVAMLNAYSRQIQDLENALQQLLTQRALDVAVGAQLDGIGSILDLPRGGDTDEPYRSRLRVALAINQSAGTTEDLYKVLTLATTSTPGVWQISDGTTAEFKVELVPGSFAMDETEATILVNYLRAARAGGVRALFVYPNYAEGDEQYFSFGPSPDVNGQSFGFNNGAFMNAIEI
jgi:hypothetical protein